MANFLCGTFRISASSGSTSANQFCFLLLDGMDPKCRCCRRCFCCSSVLRVSHPGSAAVLGTRCQGSYFSAKFGSTNSPCSYFRSPQSRITFRTRITSPRVEVEASQHGHQSSDSCCYAGCRKLPTGTSTKFSFRTPEVGHPGGHLSWTRSRIVINGYHSKLIGSSQPSVTPDSRCG